MTQPSFFHKKSFFKPIVQHTLILTLLLTVGCSQWQKRGEAPRTQPEVGAVEDGPTGKSQDGDFQTLPPQISNPSAQKVGLILGAGGAKTLAYAGLIRSFKKNKITISHVAATEWSSLVAASFALSGEVHGMDWKLYKLEGLGLKFEKGFFGIGGNQASADLDRYLKDNFAGEKLDTSKVGFTCASRSLGARQSLLISKGIASEVLKRCLSLPPFARDYNQAASPASVLKLAKSLRDQGAEIIVFVDALDSGVLTENLIKNDPALRLFWGQVLEGQEVAKSFIKNSYQLKLNKFSVFDFSKRKELEAAGESQGDKIAADLIDAYRL